MLYLRIQAGLVHNQAQGTMKLKELQLDLRRVVPILSVGVILGAMGLPTIISLAILIYSGELTPFAGAGIGLVLFGGVIIQLIIALTSSMAGVMAGPQDSPAAILGLMAVAIITQMPDASLETKFITVTVTVMITSIITGFLFLIIGGFKLGRFVRFIPYPVVGGFIAGTGLLLVKGAMGVMTGFAPDLENLGLLLMPDNLLRWVPSVIFGIALVIGSRRFQHFMTIPAILTSTALIFYGFIWASGYYMAELRAGGWLLGPFPEGGLWHPLDFSMIRQVNWSLILDQATNIAAIAFISIVAMLLNSNALELVARTDLDLNRELITTGLANIGGGLAGGSAGYHYLGYSAIPLRMNIRSRWVPVISASVMGFVLLFGASLLSLIPTLMAGGVLFFLGITFLVEWLYDAWSQLPRTDYALVLFILFVVGTFGFLEGVGTGIAIAIILFVVNYSRIDIVKDSLSGYTYQSKAERPLEQRQLLKRLGPQIKILRLHGFVFFGTSQSLVKRVSERLKDSGRETIHYLVLDFQHVSALDSSAVFSFVRLKQLADAHQFVIVLTDVNQAIKIQLARAGLQDDNSRLRFFPTMDYGMEWCESKILLDEGGSTIVHAGSLRAQLKKLLLSGEHVDKFMSYLEKEAVQEYHVVINRGDSPDCMYFIDSGQLTTRLESSKGKFIRLMTQGGGTMVGEMGLFLNQSRTATVVADQPSVLYRLSIDSYNKMMHDDPELAFHLHQWIGRVLSARLAENNSTLEALLS